MRGWARSNTLKRKRLWWREKVRDVCGGDDADETAYFIVLLRVPCSSPENHTADTLSQGRKSIQGSSCCSVKSSEPLPQGCTSHRQLPAGVLVQQGLLRGMGSWFLGDKRLLYCPTWPLGLGKPSLHRRAF